MTVAGFWKGKPIDEMPREGLLEIIQFLAQENMRLTAERSSLWKHVDVGAFLLDPSTAH